MQIFEITQRRQPVNEILGLAKAIGGAVGQTVSSAVTKQLGIQPADQDAAVGGPERQAAAAQKAMVLSKPLAMQMQRGWNDTLQALMQRSKNPRTNQPYTAVSQIDDTDLTKELVNYLNKMASGGRGGYVDITKIGSQESGTGEAEAIQQKISNGIANAIRNMKNPNSGRAVLDKDWLELANGIQAVLSFNANSGGAVNAALVTKDPSADRRLFNGKPYNSNDPAHRAAVKVLGLDPNKYDPNQSIRTAPGAAPSAQPAPATP